MDADPSVIASACCVYLGCPARFGARVSRTAIKSLCHAGPKFLRCAFLFAESARRSYRRGTQVHIHDIPSLLIVVGKARVFRMKLRPSVLTRTDAGAVACRAGFCSDSLLHVVF